MSPRRFKAPTQETLPSTSSILTRSRARRMASEEPCRPASSSAGLASPTEPSVRMSRAKATRRIPAGGAISHAKCPSSKRRIEQSASKHCRSTCASSASTNGQMRYDVNEASSCRNIRRKGDTQSTDPKSPTTRLRQPRLRPSNLTPSIGDTDVFCAKTVRTRLSTARAKATASGKKRKEALGRPQSKPRALRIEKLPGITLDDSLSADQWSSHTAPISHAEEMRRHQARHDINVGSTGEIEHEHPSTRDTSPRRALRSENRSYWTRIFTEPEAEMATSTASSLRTIVKFALFWTFAAWGLLVNVDLVPCREQYSSRFSANVFAQCE